MNSRKEKLERNRCIEMNLAEAMDVTPMQEAALMSLGYTFYLQGKLEDALNILEGLAALDENIPYVYALLGSIYQKKEDYGLAIAKYSRALIVRPDDTHSLVNRGEIFLRLGRLEEAAEDLIRAAETDPERKDPAANRARLLTSLLQDTVKTFYES